MSETIPDDMTELYDAEVPRLDLVGKGANGMPLLIAKQQEDPERPGLFAPAYVRELIAKSDKPGSAAGAAPQEVVTMSGSPSAMAEVIRQMHGAPIRKADPGPQTPEAAGLEKAEASTATMNNRPDSDFAYVESGGTKDSTGKTVPRSLRHYPVYDKTHAKNALGRAAAQIENGDDDAKRIARAALPKIRSAAKKFGVEMSKAEAATLAPVAKDLGMDMEDFEDMDTSAGMPIDEEPDSLNPSVVLAAPDCEMPGDPNEPGSAAWEAIDAATARKWTTIAARLRSALRFLADREQVEGAYADPDDFYAAADLMDAADAVDYAISVLAPFAVDEQAEADEACMAMVGKALAAVTPGDLETLETLGAVRKAGRALSAANETALRNAISALQTILASLPKAPDAQSPAMNAGMQKEADMADVETALAERHPLGTDKMPPAAEAPAAVPGAGAVAKAEDDDTPQAQGSGEAAAQSTAVAKAEDETAVASEPAPVEKTAAVTGQTSLAWTTPVPTMTLGSFSNAATATATQPLIMTTPMVVGGQLEASAAVTKAGKAPQVAIYDAHGNLVGTVDPAEITMLAPAKAPEPAMKDDDGSDGADGGSDDGHPMPEAPAAPAAPPTDLTPAPAAEVGTPADAVSDGVAKSLDQAEPGPVATEEVLKSSIAEFIKAALTDHSATQEQAFAARLAEVNKGLEERNAELEERITKNTQAFAERLAALESAPAVMAIASNGALPPPHLLRGQNHGAGATPDASTAALLKSQFRNADDAIEQKNTAEEMTRLAMAKFSAMQQEARRR